MRETEPLRPGFRLQPDTRAVQPSSATVTEGRRPFAELTEDRPAATAEPPLFASSIEEPRRRSGAAVWLASAVALVIGIGIGFASGYQAGKGAAPVAAPGPENPAATSGATGGQPFSESPVQEPVNLNPEPLVPAPEKAPAPAVVGRVPPRTKAVLADPPTPQVTGPASVQVVSRPAGAQVILDGRPVGKTPMTIPDVAAGFHDIRLELSGFKGWSTTVDVKAGTASRVAASLEQ